MDDGELTLRSLYPLSWILEFSPAINVGLFYLILLYLYIMENRLPIKLASDYNLWKQAVTDFYMNIGLRLIETKKELKNIEEIEAEMLRKQKELEEININNWIGRI